jgi:hypothetical protein
MTVKLIVHNIPPGVTQEEFRSKFMELRGFQDSKIMINSNNELLVPRHSFLIVLDMPSSNLPPMN